MGAPFFYSNYNWGVISMSIIRFFIRKYDEDFAIVCATPKGDYIVERNTQPIIKARFLFYVKNREALQATLDQKIA
jgi:hypothetical protein